jgi:hypothetical protein
MVEMKPGRTLGNGALVLHHNTDAQVVLAYSACARGNNGDYVTWLIDDDGNTVSGRYFLEEAGDAFRKAVDDFRDRCNSLLGYKEQA